MLLFSILWVMILNEGLKSLRWHQDTPRTSASYCGPNNSLQNWTCGSNQPGGWVDSLGRFWAFLEGLQPIHLCPTCCKITWAYNSPLGFPKPETLALQALRGCGDPLGFLDFEFLRAEIEADADPGVRCFRRMDVSNSFVLHCT